MKRNRLVLTLFLVLAFGLAACNGGQQQPGTPTDTPAGGAITDMTPTAEGAIGDETPMAGDTPMAGETPGTMVEGTVSILSLWGGSEQEAFQKVLDGFTAKTGAETQYEQARDFVPALRTRLASGNPPDVAIVPRPGVMTDLATEGSLTALTDLGITMDDINNSYSEAWVNLGTTNDKLYGIAVKANSKSTVWYRPDVFKEMNLQVPKTWEELKSVTEQIANSGKTPWAVGGQDSWTLTDWFENIYVRSAGPEAYSDLFEGRKPFTDQTVVDALNEMTSIIAQDKYVAGGRQGALGTKFVDGIGRVFGTNADAVLYYEGGFVGGIAMGEVNPNLKPGQDIDFFPFPTINEQYGSPVVGGGDLMVVFNDTPAVREFIRYMISKEAGEIWAKTGAIVSPNKQVDKSAYPNELTQKEAEQLTTAETFRFDGSDLLPGTLADEWGTTLQGILEDPNNTQQLLQDFESKASQEFKR